MRALFTTVSSIGHFHAVVPLAKALQQAGHTVAFVYPPSFADTIAASGFDIHPVIAEGYDDPETMRRWAEVNASDRTETHEGNILAMSIFVGPDTRRVLAGLIPFCREWRPDVIVRDEAAPAGSIAGELLGLPAVSVQILLSHPTLLADPRVTTELDTVRAEWGLAPDPDRKRWYADLTLAFAPEALLDPELAARDDIQVVRPAAFDASGAEQLPAWVAELPRDRPTVYATLGTAMPGIPGIFPDAYQTIVDAFRDEAVNLIVTVGRKQDPSVFEPLPPHIRVERYIPQAELLPHCDLMVCHGGLNTLVGAIDAGLPLVLLPQVTIDQQLNALRCAELGIGIALPPGPRTPDEVRAAFRAVLAEPSYADTCKRIRSETATQPPVEHAVSLVERLVARP